MKRYVLFSTAFALLAFAASVPAQAGTFFTDTFNYPDGNLTVEDGTGGDVSGGLWVPHSGTGFGGPIDVTGGQAQLLNSGSEDAHRETGGFNSAGTTWYYAAMITVNDTRAVSTDPINNDYFAHFWGPSFAFRGRAYLDDPNVADPTKFTLGLSATSGGQTAKWGSDLNFGQQYKVVVSFEFDTGVSQLWVDPVDVNSTSIADVGGAAAGSFVSALALRQDFVGDTPNNQILVDAVSIGDMFGSVVTDVMVPEPASMVLALAGLVGMASLRRRV